MKKIIVISLLFLAIFVSGCVQNQENEKPPTDVQTLIDQQNSDPESVFVGEGGSAWESKNQGTLEQLTLRKEGKTATLSVNENPDSAEDTVYDGVWVFIKNNKGNHIIINTTYQNKNVKLIYSCISFVREKEELITGFRSFFNVTIEENIQLLCQGEPKTFNTF